LHDIIKAHPKNFAAIGTLPLNDPSEISNEMEYAVNELGIKGFLVPTQVNGKCIASEDFVSVFKECSRLHVPLYIHPWVGIHLSHLYKKEDITATIFPAETAATALRICTSGLARRHPNLRKILSHLGGNLPYILGRIERESEPLSERKILETKTVWRLKQFFFDSICYSSSALEFAADTWGSDKILFGSDTPFPWSDSFKRSGE
jgi:predicted TIM-barrel fold metal-dependent hydrolase